MPLVELSAACSDEKRCPFFIGEPEDRSARVLGVPNPDIVAILGDFDTTRLATRTALTPGRSSRGQRHLRHAGTPSLSRTARLSLSVNNALGCLAVNARERRGEAADPTGEVHVNRLAPPSIQTTRTSCLRTQCNWLRPNQDLSRQASHRAAAPRRTTGASDAKPETKDAAADHVQVEGEHSAPSHSARRRSDTLPSVTCRLPVGILASALCIVASTKMQFRAHRSVGQQAFCPVLNDRSQHVW